MSVISVHGPNTMFTSEGGGAPVASSPAGATATKSVTNGLTFAFSFPNPGARPATDFDWTFTGPGSPAAQADRYGGTVTFTGAGAGTIVCTVAAGAGPPAGGVYTINVTATAGVPKSAEEGGEEPPTNGNGAYYPGEHTVAEVQQEANDNADDVAYIQSLLDAERSDKNRSTLVSYLESLLPYDPAAHTVDEVVAYAEDHPDEVADIIASEQANKNRSTLLSQLEALQTT